MKKIINRIAGVIVGILIGMAFSGGIISYIEFFIPHKTIYVCPVKIDEQTLVLEYPKTKEDCGTAEIFLINIK